MAHSSFTEVIDQSWDPPSCCSPFPVSDLRSTPRDHPCIVSTSTNFLQPIVPLSGAYTIAPYPTKYPTSIPVWTELERGVWSNGTQSVLSASYPAVQDFLALARRRMSLPVSPSELIFALAALDVFYNRNDPAHWMFWSDEKKYQTARVVNRIALRSPQLIRSDVAWNGIPEYLFILSGLHGSSSLPVDKEWYGVLNPSKAPPPPMNLRKRKPQQTEQSEPLESPEDEGGLEEEEPRTKRPRTRSTRPIKPKTPITQEQTKSSPSTSHSPLSEASPASTIIPLPIEDKYGPPNASSDNASQEEATLSSDRPLPTAEPSCPRLQVNCLSSTPDPLSLLGAPPSSVSDVLTSPPQTSSHTRNRSTSQASSSQTLVSESASERRSLSVLSNLTAVEASIVGRPAGDVNKVDQTPSDHEDNVEEGDEEESGMVTRGRANKARTAAVQGKVANRPTKPRAKTRAAK